jgi:hypothetical protein
MLCVRVRVDRLFDSKMVCNHCVSHSPTRRVESVDQKGPSPRRRGTSCQPTSITVVMDGRMRAMRPPKKSCVNAAHRHALAEVTRSCELTSTNPREVSVNLPLQAADEREGLVHARRTSCS